VNNQTPIPKSRYKNQRLLLIDYNDSFTFNVVELLRKIGNNITTVINYEDLVVTELSEFDKIILSPGPCLPQDYPKTFEVIKQYYKQKPILGICLGHQAICSFFGAELYNFKEVIHGVNQKIILTEKNSLFKGVPNKTEVGLYHSWAVKNAPNSLKILAVTEGEVIMSIKHIDYPVYGIQFHPESFLTTHGELIIENFFKL